MKLLTYWWHRATHKHEWASVDGNDVNVAPGEGSYWTLVKCKHCPTQREVIGL